MGKLTCFFDYVIEMTANAFPKSNLPGSDRRGAELLLLADLVDSNPVSLAEHLDLIASAKKSNEPFAISPSVACDVLAGHLHERHADTFSKACALLKTPQALHLCLLAFSQAISSLSHSLEHNPCAEIDLATGKRLDWPMTPADELQIKQSIPVIQTVAGLAQGWTRIHEKLGAPLPRSLSGGMALLDISAEPLALLSASLSELAFKIPLHLGLGSIDSVRSRPLQDAYLEALGKLPDGSLIKSCSDILNQRRRPITPEEFPALAEACALRAMTPTPKVQTPKANRL